jgi:hypothetical protein
MSRVKNTVNAQVCVVRHTRRTVSTSPGVITGVIESEISAVAFAQEDKFATKRKWACACKHALISTQYQHDLQCCPNRQCLGAHELQLWLDEFKRLIDRLSQCAGQHDGHAGHAAHELCNLDQRHWLARAQYCAVQCVAGDKTDCVILS